MKSKAQEAYRKQYGCDFISAMPTNLYGPNDNYDPEGSHVLPAMIRRIHEAKVNGAESVTCWGSGSPMREFLHSDDLARACLFLMKNYSEENFINIGLGTKLSIRELSELVAVGYTGRLEWDTTKSDGTPRRLMDGSRLKELGWKPEISLREGIAAAYVEFQEKYA